MSITCEGYYKSDGDLPCSHYLKGNLDEAGFCNRKESFRCIEAIKAYLPNFTQSSFKMFRQFPYKYLLTYIYGFKPHDHTLPDPMKAGSIWDAFKDSRYSLSRFDLPPLIKKYRIQLQLEAKLTALMKAYYELEIDTNLDNPEAQKHIAWECGDI